MLLDLGILAVTLLLIVTVGMELAAGASTIKNFRGRRNHR